MPVFPYPVYRVYPLMIKQHVIWDVILYGELTLLDKIKEDITHTHTVKCTVRHSLIGCYCQNKRKCTMTQTISILVGDGDSMSVICDCALYWLWLYLQ